MRDRSGQIWSLNCGNFDLNSAPSHSLNPLASLGWDGGQSGADAMRPSGPETFAADNRTMKPFDFRVVHVL